MAQNAKADCMLSPVALNSMASLYLGELDARAPLASPLFGDLTGLPPVLIHVGSEEVLRSDAERFAERVIEAGGDAQVEVWPEMPHVFQILAARIPEGKAAITALSEFVRRSLS